MWQSATGSPSRSAANDPLSFCGEADEALARVATRLAVRASKGLPVPDALELAFYLRVEGEPHVWPHAWTLSGTEPASDDEAGRLRRFVDALPAKGVRRCGIGRAARNGDAFVAAVVVDALADLEALPTFAHAGQWMRFDARMLVPSRSAKLVVLGPSGLPRTAPTTLHGEHVEATFGLERPGPFTVQLLADVDRGPRPVLEAMLFADVDAPGQWVEWPAPGESGAASARTDEDALFAMVNAARRAEGLTTLARSGVLDRAAEEHALRMRDSGNLAHDAGDGGPLERLRRAGVQAAIAGENVAHEATVVRAHRALWASPSHRENLLDARFTAMGVGLAPGRDGSLWICETFIDFAAAGNGSVDPHE